MHRRELNHVYGSLKAATVGMGIPIHVLKWAKAKGCLAFKSNRVYADILVEWLKTNQPDEETLQGEISSKEQKTREEVRKLKLANDLKEGKLITRAWIVERFNRAAGELHAARSKSEAEHPLLFSAAGNDVAGCRTILRGIWADIFTKIGDLGEHFTEGEDENVIAEEESKSGPKSEIDKALARANDD
jgi:hypothetical protein